MTFDQIAAVVGIALSAFGLGAFAAWQVTRKLLNNVEVWIGIVRAMPEEKLLFIVNEIRERRERERAAMLPTEPNK